MINIAAKTVKQACVRCGVEAEIFVIPLCDKCLPKMESWAQLKEWKNQEAQP